MTKEREELLDHEVDGIRELDNALPRWWLYGFYFTIVFGVAYYANYHLLAQPFFGKSTLVAEHAAEVEAAARLRPEPIAATRLVAVRTDANSLANGDAIFHGQANSCHACHRADLGGLIGPNLTDDFWLHGCSPADIGRSITSGFPDKGMQPFGTTARLTEDQLIDVVSYIVARRGLAPAGAKIELFAARQGLCDKRAVAGFHDMLDAAHDRFRDELASVHVDGRRRWVYAREPRGRFHRARVAVSACLLAFLVAAPFLRYQGEPLVLLNVLERKFVLFGLVFWPQDFYLVVLLALTGLVTLAASTAAFGRIWCGWLCPQTVFLEMVFRKIEFVIEGSAAEQLRASKGPRTAARTVRFVLKHAIFFALSFAIANLFLAYIIGTEALTTIVTDPPMRHLVGLVAITIFSLLFYGVFARFREQACTLACPYGRVMSALIDRHTITVTYDTVRGEPRGKLAAVGATPRGDCVDCGQCVTVCPTGIDIRNGIQLECVNCTACIDACDDVMTRLTRPRGLIRLTSEEAVRTGTARWFTPRVRAYGLMSCALIVAVTSLLLLRPAIDVLILRQSGTAYSTLDGGAVANFYNVQVINRAAEERVLEYRVTTPVGAVINALGPIERVPPHRVVESRLMLRIPRERLTGTATPVHFEILADGHIVERVVSSFLGPGVP